MFKRIVLSVNALLWSSSALAQQSEIAGLEQRHWPSVGLGQSIDGSLSADDLKRTDGSYADGFFYDAKSGETAIVTLRSPDFDSWLVVDDPASPMIETDDDAGGGTNSRLTVTFPHAGRYLILANALEAGKTGSYTLSVDPASPAEAAWATLAEQLYGKAGEVYASRGYHRAAFVRTGSLAAGASDRMAIATSKDHPWNMLGVCDTHCSDLDLEVLDASGKVVDADSLADDAPVVGPKLAGQAGNFTLVVKMAKCDTGSCFYRVREYEKQ